jgi:hypothetical protein
MPSPASIWLTAEPATPLKPVLLELFAPPDLVAFRDHTFPAGEVLRGDIPLSNGRFRLEALGGACALDLFLGPERETDLVLTIGADDACAFSVTKEHGLGAEVGHEEPAVLIAP